MKTELTVSEQEMMKAAKAKVRSLAETPMTDLTPAAFIHNVGIIARATSRSFVEVVASVKAFVKAEQQRHAAYRRWKRSEDYQIEQAWEKAMPYHQAFEE